MFCAYIASSRSTLVCFAQHGLVEGGMNGDGEYSDDASSTFSAVTLEE